MSEHTRSFCTYRAALLPYCYRRAQVTRVFSNRIFRQNAFIRLAPRGPNVNDRRRRRYRRTRYLPSDSDNNLPDRINLRRTGATCFSTRKYNATYKNYRFASTRTRTRRDNTRILLCRAIK